MTTAIEKHDWDAGIARRMRTLGGGEITAILALAGAHRCDHLFRRVP